MKKLKNQKYTGINRILKINFLQTILDKRRDGTFKEFAEDWKWIFSFSKKYRLIVFAYTMLGILGSTLSLGASWLSKILINIIVDKQFDRLWFLLIGMVFSTLFALFLNSFISRVGLKMSIYVNNDIQSEIFGKIVDSQWKELKKYSNGDLLNRFSNDTSTVAQNAVSWIPNMIIALYSFIATLILLFKTDPNMAWIALLSAPVLLIMSRYILRKLREYKKRVLEMNSQMTAFEVDTFYNIDTLKSFGVTKQSENRLKWWQKRYKDYNLDYNKFEIKANIAVSLVSTLVSLLAFSYCLWRLWTGQILYGDMTFFLTQRRTLTNRFNTIANTFPSMVSSAVSAHRIREIVDLPKEEHNRESLEKISYYAEKGLTVKMNGVSFAYDSDTPVYEQGDFYASPGETVAVLGPSGEGKTTMIRLILGLIRPTNGSVTVTDAKGNEVEMNADLRVLFSYVPQGNSLLAGTVRENMLLVKENATDEQIINALKLSCAWDFLNNKGGLDAVVGERGLGFSEGQSQRIAIARAILRDAPVLILDEATSALDADTEKKVIDNIITNCPNKTCIVSTHRKSILSSCKRVYFIKDKKTVML